MDTYRQPYGQGLISQPNLIKWLDLSRPAFFKLRKKDPSFPLPIKEGKTRQASVYYVMDEVKTWLASKVSERSVS